MSDAGEPDASGSTNFTNNFSLFSFGRRAQAPIFPSEIRIPGLEEASSQIGNLNTQLQDLQRTLTSLANSQTTLSSGINNMLRGIGQNAQQASSAVGNVTAAMSGGRAGGFSVSNMLGSFVNSDILKDMAMFPLRFIQTTLTQNRNLAMATAATLGGTQFATNTPIAQMMQFLAGIPGNVMGSPEDLLALMGAARAAGGLFTPAAVMRGNPLIPGRGPGFLSAVQQAQLMTPGTPVAQIGASIAGYVGNVGAQQTSAFLTGGAFSMVAPGGGMKNISQWSEGILRWLENQRPGNKRGKPFSYGELLSQYFPGSNIDAWLATNGVPPDMREYFWNYALGKTRRTGTTGGLELDIGTSVEQGNLLYQRLQATTAMTRTGFGLGGTMAGAYANKEVANRWFNEIMGQAVRTIIPARVSQGPLAAMQFLPDPVEELLFNLLERGGLLGTMVGGYLGWDPNITSIKSLFGTLAGSFDLFSGKSDVFDVLQNQYFGDVGDDGVAGWSSVGTTTTAGMHPDMRRKVGAMMRANPRLRITSGLRDTATQRRLKAKGYSRVSGGPSAHTRGYAADLGPRSEYNWIVANASRFGLKSGVGSGEPWHVGMGDVGDSSMGTFGGLFQLLTGSASQETTVSTIGNIIPAIMNLFFGLFGGAATGVDASRLAFLPNLYEQFRGLDVSTGKLPITGGAFGGGFGAGTGTGTGTTGAPATGSMMDRAVAAARAAAAAGFTGTDLFKAVSISGRESGGWNPMAYNPNARTGDKSYGLMQINMIGALGPDRMRRYNLSSYEDLFDPATNMRVAYGMYSDRGGSFYDWGPYKGVSELYSTEKYQATARAAIQQAGVGDIEAAMAGGGTVRLGNTMHFHNTFNIGEGGGGGGIDVRRTVTMIADHLEDEMNRRMARRN